MDRAHPGAVRGTGIKRPARQDEGLRHDGALRRQIDVQKWIGRPLGQTNAVHYAIEAAEVHLSGRVDAERGDVAERGRSAELGGVFEETGCRGLTGRRIDVQRERPDATGTEIREEIASAESRAERRSAIHDPAGDDRAVTTAVLEDRIDQREKRRWTVGDVVQRAFAITPAVVPSAPSRRLVVDFLARALTDIADDHRSRAAVHGIVEAPAPGVAQSKTPDLAEVARPTDERVGRRHGVTIGVAARDVDPQHLSQQATRGLREMIRIVAVPPVTHADVKVSIGPEREVAAVVIRERMEDGLLAVRPAEVEAGSRVGDERIARSEKPRDDDMAGGVGEADVEPAGRSVVGRKGQAEQSLLAASGHQR